MEKKITQKQFLSVWHFIYYQHRREIRTFLNLTELLASNRIKETYSYYFYIKNRKQKGKKKFKSKFFFFFIWGNSCLNFLDETWWFLSYRLFELLSSSLLLYFQCFTQNVFQPSSGVYQTQNPIQNFLYLIHGGGTLVLILLTITEYKC